MVNIYKAFILPHLENCAPVLVGKSSALSNKLELTNRYAIRTLLNMSKSTTYSDLLTYVGLKTLEHRWYSHTVLTFVYFLFFTFIPLYFFILFFSLYCYFFPVLTCTGFIVIWHVHVYTSLALIRVMWINKIPTYTMCILARLNVFIVNF